MAGKEACKKRPQLLYKVVQVNKKGKKMYLNCVRFHIMAFIDDMYQKHSILVIISVFTILTECKVN